MTAAPLPPVELATRVGPGESDDAYEAYEREGALVRERIERVLPAGWSWEGKRVLDFGCGSGRVLRHFLPEAGRGEFWGCDIDAASVDWIAAHLSPPLRSFRNDLVPPLDVPSGHFDLVYATSVFTHIGDTWADWLLEVHRVLAPGGTFVASFLGEGMWEALVGLPHVEDAVGMTVKHHWSGPDAWVFHSEWWLREHWGRAFDVLGVARPPRSAGGGPEITHSYIALRKRDVAVTKAELERPDPRDPRELAGLQTTIEVLKLELEAMHREPPAPLALPDALRQAVLATPLAGPARALRRRLRPDL